MRGTSILPWGPGIPRSLPAALPEFLIKLLTEEHDLVVDPFAGSNTTGATAERLCRRPIGSLGK